MWELFLEYKDSLKPRTIQKATPKGVLTELHTPPLTMAGFDCFVMESEGIESKGVEQYFSNRDGRYSDYVGICSRIKKLIRKDQIEGGMVGQYNSSITQRLNGLTEKTENTNQNTNVTEIQVEIVRNKTQDNE